MVSTTESLQALELLMSEFFNTDTTNIRKHEIEVLLESFGQTKDAWRHCLYFIANTSNEYVMMYCLNVLEKLINQQWVGQDGQTKLEVRSMLNQFLLTRHDKVQSYVRNKLVKLVVDIGRSDWPHFYPDFFSSILQLVQQPDTTMLGVILLQTASEEMATPREDISMSRKEELNRLLLAQVQTVLSILNNILETVLEEHRHLVCATPPPSPTHGNQSITCLPSLMLFSSSPVRSDSVLSTLFQKPSQGFKFDALPLLDDHSQQLCAATLTCLAHYFSWIPLSTSITTDLLSTMFHFAGFGCEIHKQRSSNPSSGCNSQDLGMLAMNCVNELLSKNCVPQEFEDFLLQMFQQTFYLLQRLTKEYSTNATGNRLEELDGSYIEKFTDFLQLFVSIHLRRFESNSQFPVLEFLALFFKYTFRQPTHEGFFHCLDIWTTFLDYLVTKCKERSTDAASIIQRYKEALTSLVSHIFQKLLFRYNQSQLEELDDEILTDDDETEWQHFLRNCLEVVAKVAELIPAEIFQLIWDQFQEHVTAYLAMESCVTASAEGRQLRISGENECRRLHCTLRDLSSYIQALGRLAEHFIGDMFAERYTNARQLLEKLVYLSAYSCKLKLFEVKSIAQSVLEPDFIEVHAQVLAGIKAYSHWMSQLYSESQRTNQEKEKFFNLIVALTDSVVPLFHKQTPEKIVQSAAHLLVSLTTTVRPAFLLQLESMQSLYNSATDGLCCHFKPETRLLLYRSLSHYLLLPWPNLSDAEQDWANRSQHHAKFTQQLASQYLRLKDTAAISHNKVMQEQAKPVIKETLKMFEEWITSIAGEVVRSKQICFQSLQESIQVALTLFPLFMQQPDIIDEMMSFFLALFQGLRVQMGVPFTENALRTFVALFTRDQLANIIQQGSSASISVVEKFLKLLQLIVEEPGSSFKAFLPQVLTICLDQVYPIIAQRPSPDIKVVFYKLLHELVIHNWRYFFKGSVISALQNEAEQLDNEPQFVAIMQAYGQSFLQSDITVFKQNLESLEIMNSKWKLYHKVIFRKLMLAQILHIHL
ncbi:exportin-6-like isoform X2 [Gigantopelta aegis]|uniref:exportin-6-like isoform X2 n=1 Tax=Gigantopelta aegis TaxID=1735272 RepID=UPI001B88E03D|nr:exportin-6-like isoform X2 [Gigantopelta aegis]